MKSTGFPVSQRGATLVVGLIMLVLITLLVTSAFMLSSSNLRSVGNMQNRNEAIAAANKAIEQVVSSPFTDAPAAEAINVDIDNDDTTDYVVNFAAPSCVSGSLLPGAVAPGPTSYPLTLAPASTAFYETVWDLEANVVDSNDSGAAVRVRQGVRVVLTEAQFNAVCGP